MISSVMQTLHPALLAILFYLGAGLVIGLRLFASPGRKPPPRLLALALAYAGLFLHAWVLYVTLTQGAGINLGFFSSASLVAWTVIALLLVSAVTKPVDNLGILALPAAAGALALQLRYPGSRFLGPDTDWALGLHVMSSILAYSLMTLATAQAMLLAIQDRQLRGHHPGGFIRALPPLQTMETLLFEMISVGFGLLSLALLSGFFYLDDMFAQHLVHKTVLSLVAWVTFGTLLWGRLRFGWRGRKAIRWTLIGFVVLVLAYFGSKAVLELILNR